MNLTKIPFALILTAIIISILTFDAYAQTFDFITSPKKQMDNGIMPYNVVCRDGLGLAERGFEKIACVQEAMVEKM